MKMQTGDYQELTRLLDQTVEFVGMDSIKNHRKDLAKDARVDDVAKRFRWDLFYSIPLDERKPLMDRLTLYLTEDHIDDALHIYAIAKGIDSEQTNFTIH